MIDPINFTKYDRNENELQEVVVFGLLVAGKNALTTSRLLDALLRDYDHIGSGAFEILSHFELEKPPRLSIVLKDYGFGCYNMKAKGLYELVRSGINLRTCTVDDLKKIRGIGLKTANLFLMHTRKDYKGCCVDIHLLKFLRDLGYAVPKSTPSSKKIYHEISKLFIELTDVHGVSTTELDLMIWNAYSSKNSQDIQVLLQKFNTKLVLYIN
jgi:thermostable 8-oxoguanine DNA glycosylase